MINKGLKPAQIFSDNMVLQQKKPIIVWGTGKSGDTVTVSMGGNRVSCLIKDEKWQVELPRMNAGGPYVLRISNEELEYIYENVMIGEVWFAGGQSNMELELKDSLNGEDEVLAADHPMIRFYNVAKISTLEEESLQEENKCYWKVVSKETASNISAVAYYYACELVKKLNVPVGIIDCYWGGTSISCWTSKEYLLEDKVSEEYVTSWDAEVGDKTDEEYEKELVDYNIRLNKWQQDCEELKRNQPDIDWSKIEEYIGPFPWPAPYGRKSPYRPGGLYETMVQRVVPFVVKGFLWYQGEEDEKRPYIYDRMLSKLIRQWRSDWNDDNLPFIIMQLPMFIETGKEDTKHWAILREQQRKIAATVKNVYLTVLIDCGEIDNIHPLDKKTVGYRAALQSLENVYFVKNLYANSPMYESRDLKSNKIVLYFNYVYGGFEVSDGEYIPLFEIAGEDRVFRKAEARIVGETIEVSCENVNNPKYARYGWTNYGIVNLYNAKGMPVAPFVTK